MRFLILLLLILLSSCQKEERVPVAYVASEKCAGCHPQEAKHYRRVGMSRSFATLSPAAEFVEAQFTHQASGRIYAVIKRDGQMIQRRWEPGPANLVEMAATHVVGSGHHAKTYLHRSASGEMIELPLTWYPQQKRWDLSPGFNQAQPKDFTRLVDDRCLFCHNGYPDAAGKLAEGIDCQRCHGPGAAHVDLATAGKPSAAAIVNPKKLDPIRREEVCLQCHLETTSAELPAILRRFDRPVNSFRPGEAPGTYAVHFDDGRTEKFEVVNQGYRMRQSACYLKSGGKLACTTCHNPHAAQAADYRAQCLSCHATPHTQENCISCHMPRRAVEDVPHVMMTDHKIARPSSPAHTVVSKGLPPVLYAPIQEHDLYLGAALIVNGRKRQDGIAMLEHVADPPARGLAVLGEGYYAEGRYADAVTALRKALGKDPSLAKAHYNLAQALEASGSSTEARGEFEQALRLQPVFPEANYAFGNLLLKSGDSSGAEAQYAAALKVRPSYAEARNNLGSLYLDTGKLVEAQAALGLALSYDPGLVDAHNNLGRLAAAKHDLPESIRYLRRALVLDPAHAQARFNLARVLQESGDLRSAIAEYRNVLGRKPDFVEAHLAFGQCLGDAEQIDAAIAEFREVLRLQPGHPVAQQNLSMALSMRQR